MPISINDQVAHPNLMWPTPTQDSATESTKKYSQGGKPLTLAVKESDEDKTDTRLEDSVNMLENIPHLGCKAVTRNRCGGSSTRTPYLETEVAYQLTKKEEVVCKSLVAH